MHSIVLKARGKINLTLDVIGKRDNGYHDLRMIMQSINLCDIIRIKKIKTPGIRINTNLKWLPKDDRNIAYRAAQLFLEESRIESGVFIEIQKKIPVAAGLAGGSSDAATVLVGLNKVFRTKYSKKQLMEMGLKLGADVPFCIERGTVLAEGIGEELTPLTSLPHTYIVLAKPNISVSTATVYKNVKLDAIKEHPETEAIIQAIEDQNVDFIATSMKNVLQEVTIPMHPEIEDIKRKMLEHDALGSMMSGSGPTVFGIFRTKEQAIKAANYFKTKENLREVFVTSTYNRPKKEVWGNERRAKQHENK